MAKSWIEKLEAKDKDLPKVVELDEKMRKRYPWARTMLVPHPRQVYEIMARVPRGNLITVNEIRDMLAKKFGADITCPLTTGIFITIAANAAEEIAQQTGQPPIPWWRTLRSKGELNDKAPGGKENHARLLQEEGFNIITRGKKWKVANYENFVLPVV